MIAGGPEALGGEEVAHHTMETTATREWGEKEETAS